MAKRRAALVLSLLKGEMIPKEEDALREASSPIHLETSQTALGFAHGLNKIVGE
jgi:hypothetical protein